jgi:P-type conjugative transfer protein TrbJ
MRGLVGAAGWQTNMLNNEQIWMAKIQALNSMPNGRNQSLQLTNSIGMETVAQIQKLRALMVADMSSKAAYTAQLINADQMKQSSQSNAFAPVNYGADGRIW